MSEPVTISDIRFVPAPAAEVRTGLLGYLGATLNGTLRLEGLVVRRTLDGRFVISYPSRRDAAGRKHFLIRPLTDAARRDLERQVFHELGLEERTAR